MPAFCMWNSTKKDFVENLGLRKIFVVLFGTVCIFIVSVVSPALYDSSEIYFNSLCLSRHQHLMPPNTGKLSQKTLKTALKHPKLHQQTEMFANVMLILTMLAHMQFSNMD
jgi:hypothetical protein